MALLVELKFFRHFSLVFCTVGIHVFVSLVVSSHETTFELLHFVVEALVWVLIPYFLENDGVFRVYGPIVFEFEALWALLIWRESR